MVPDEEDRERIVLDWNGSQNRTVPWAERTQLKKSQSLLDGAINTPREVRTRRASFGEAARALAKLVRFAGCRQSGRAEKRSERAKTREIPVDDTGAALGLRTDAENASFCKRSDQNGGSLPEEEGTALGAPRGVSLCRDITNFVIVPYHTRQGRSPGTLPFAGWGLRIRTNSGSAHSRRRWRPQAGLHTKTFRFESGGNEPLR